MKISPFSLTVPMLAISLALTGCSHSASTTSGGSNSTNPPLHASEQTNQKNPTVPIQKATSKSSPNTSSAVPKKNLEVASTASTPPGTFRLRLSPKPGKVDQYTVTTSNPSKNGQNVVSKFYLRVSYDPISANKIRRTTQITGFDLNDMLSKVPASKRAAQQKLLTSQATAIEHLRTVEDLTSDGRFIDIHVEGGPKGMTQPAQTQGISMVVFPSHPVKVGGTWQSPLGPDEVRCTLEKIEHVNGDAVAEVSISPVIAPASTIKATRIVKFDLKDGTPLSSKIVQTQVVNGKTYTQITSVNRN